MVLTVSAGLLIFPCILFWLTRVWNGIGQKRCLVFDSVLCDKTLNLFPAAAIN